MNVDLFAIDFADHIAQKGYVFAHSENGLCYWMNDFGIKSTDEIYVEFKEIRNAFSKVINS